MLGDIVVVGSINMDVVNHVTRHPNLGETIEGLSTEYSPGGKGANQAIAAALAGGRVKMIGAVGEDTFASELARHLTDFNVQTRLMLRKPGTTGLAFITVDVNGENTIILSRGANGKFLTSDLEALRDTIAEAGIILLQNEIPWETTFMAMEIAHEYGVPVFFNPAPALKPVKALYSMVELLVLNENEASMMTNQPVRTVEEAQRAAEYLVDAGVTSVVVTLGDKGSIYVDSNKKTTYTPAFKVTPVDTTAAGDTFIGYLATAQWSGEAIESGLRFASAASAISVMREGAQNSIPSKQEVEEFLQAVASSI